MNLKSIIEIYTLNVQEYLKQVCSQLSETQIKDQYEHIYNGWLVLIHILAITYNSTHDLKMCHHKMTHARLLYLEFINQICSYKEYLSNPSIFVCSKILNDLPHVSESENKNEKENIPFQSMKQYADFVLGWENRHIHMEQRLYLANVFLQPYLIHLSEFSPNILVFMENIYHKYNVNSDSKHYTLLNELFLQITSRNNKKKWQNILHIDFVSIPHYISEESLQKYIENVIQTCVVSTA